MQHQLPLSNPRFLFGGNVLLFSCLDNLCLFGLLAASISELDMMRKFSIASGAERTSEDLIDKNLSISSLSFSFGREKRFSFESKCWILRLTLKWNVSRDIFRLDRWRRLKCCLQSPIYAIFRHGTRPGIEPPIFRWAFPWVLTPCPLLRKYNIRLLRHFWIVQSNSAGSYDQWQFVSSRTYGVHSISQIRKVF